MSTICGPCPLVGHLVFGLFFGIKWNPFMTVILVPSENHDGDTALLDPNWRSLPVPYVLEPAIGSSFPVLWSGTARPTF